MSSREVLILFLFQVQSPQGSDFSFHPSTQPLPEDKPQEREGACPEVTDYRDKHALLGGAELSP